MRDTAPACKGPENIFSHPGSHYENILPLNHFPELKLFWLFHIRYLVCYVFLSGLLVGLKWAGLI